MCRAYLVAKPSRFPPSPMVIYTGADRSFTGVQTPFTILYAILDIRFWYIHTYTNYLILEANRKKKIHKAQKDIFSFL